MRRPIGPTRREVVQGVARELSSQGIESSRLEAERLVSTVLDVKPADLLDQGGVQLDPATAGRVAMAVARRLNGEPLQHIEGTAEFRSIELISDTRALIPRPETEELVDHIGNWIGKRAPIHRGLDIGTGSGAIALALLDEGLVSHIVGLDVSQEALAQAKENIEMSGIEGLELRLCQSDIWSAMLPQETFGLVVSNPPYVASMDWRRLDPKVRDYEPRLAIDGGPDGLKVIRQIISGAAIALESDGAIFLEIDSSKGPAVLDLLRSTPGLSEARISPDLSGRSRFASAIKRADLRV